MPPKTRDSEAARDTISHSYLSVLYIVMVVVLLVVVLEVFAATFKMTSHLVLLDAIKA